jgi:hypothetical protein
MMKRMVLILISSLLFVGCSANSESEAALPDMKWHSADEIDPPHLNIEHIVELKGEGKLVLDGRTMDENAAKKAFSEIADDQILAYIDYRPACSDQTPNVLKFRKLIENSGVCADNFCICGGYFNYEEPPPKPK